MRAFPLFLGLLVTSAIVGPANEQLSVDKVDPIVTGQKITIGHKSEWKAAHALFKTCPACVPGQAYPEDG